MKLEQTIIQSDTLNTGAPGALLPLAALCCLVVALVSMGLKLPWFRRQMRLGNMAHATAATSTQRELTANVTNMPIQGVFRRLSFESLPVLAPPIPPRKESVRPKSIPQPTSIKTTEIRAKSQPPPSVKAKAKPISITPPPTKMKANPVAVIPPPPKLKSAPPSRRNPNAIAFSTTSAATISIKSNHREVVEAANPMHETMENNTGNEYNDFLSSPSNGNAILPFSRSPKLPSKKDPKKDPKIRKAAKEKKSPFFAKMSPKAVKAPSPAAPISPPPPPQIPTVTRRRYSSASEEEDNNGNLTFTLPNPSEPMPVQQSFLHMGGGGEEDECDA